MFLTTKAYFKPSDEEVGSVVEMLSGYLKERGIMQEGAEVLYLNFEDGELDVHWTVEEE